MINDFSMQTTFQCKQILNENIIFNTVIINSNNFQYLHVCTYLCVL